ncbi:hypothetical protein GGQ84_000495 [Desulfitispora alkaliphila]|uniref:hypothetical protein n=1 Tax=Desulfitispora alkaliphila TaxID=622674 RepID=UPI003D19B6AA
MKKIKLAETAKQAIESKKKFKNQFKEPKETQPESPSPQVPPTSPKIDNTLAPKLPFEDSHKRITTYLEKSLHSKVTQLKATGKISSITALINLAVEDYIKKHHL